MGVSYFLSSILVYIYLALVLEVPCLFHHPFVLFSFLYYNLFTSNKKKKKNLKLLFVIVIQISESASLLVFGERSQALQSNSLVELLLVSGSQGLCLRHIL